MKYMNRLAVGALLVLTLISFALVIQNASAQQETKKPKFKPAPSGARGIRADLYEVLFDQKLSVEDFEEQLQRVIIQYGAELVDPDDIGPDTKTKISDLRYAVLRVPEVRAKQIAEDNAVVSVSQQYEIPTIVEPSNRQLPTSGEAPIPGKLNNPSNKTIPKKDGLKLQKDRSKTRKYDLRTESSSFRLTNFYHLDRIDSDIIDYDNIYDNTNDSSANVDIYFFDTGLQTNHPEFGLRATVFRNNWLQEQYFTNPPDHGTKVVSAAAGLTTGVANLANIFMIRTHRERAGFPNEFMTPATWITYINDVRSNILTRRPRRAIVNFGLILFSGDATAGMRTALANLINDTQTPVFAAIGQSSNLADTTTRANLWPPDQANVITVGMSDSDDLSVDYTFTHNLINYSVQQFGGVDIFAPAGPRFFGTGGFPNADQYGIEVAQAGSTGTIRDLGSSYASPQAAGVAAMYLAINNSYTPTRKIVQDWLFDFATKNRLDNLDVAHGDQDRLIYSLAPIVAARNAASFAEGCAPDSLAAGFSDFGGNSTMIDFYNDAGPVAGYSILPAGTTQVNFYVPNISSGTYAVKMSDSGVLLSSGPIRLNPIAPGLFSQDSDGNGLASGQLLLVNKSNPTDQQFIQLSSSGNIWNPTTHDAFLIIYGTGIRGHSGLGSVSLQVKRGSTIHVVPVLYAGAQGSPGLDQVNAGPLPAALLGLANPSTHELKLFLNGFPGVAANIVEAKFK